MGYAPREDPLPKFVGTAALRNGAIVIRGEDEMSLKWLESQMESILPWEDAKLRVVGMDDLQRRHKPIVWIPSPPESTVAILELLEKQNPGIGAQNWRVLLFLPFRREEELYFRAQSSHR